MLKKSIIISRLVMIKFGIYSNPTKDINLEKAIRLSEILRLKGLKFSVDSQLKDVIDAPIASIGDTDILLVLGGDGTMLSAVHKYHSGNIKFLGINLGTLGFMMDTEFASVETAIDDILDAKYYIDGRMLIRVSIRDCNERTKKSSFALNEAVISRGSTMHVITITVNIDNSFADRFPADGVIVATPTGSTGYSLSAGGPIMAPGLDSLLITPVCPHRLSSKSIVISGSSIVRLISESDNAVLTLDGQESFDLVKNDRVYIEDAKEEVSFIRFKNWDFYKSLTEKLPEWSN